MDVACYVNRLASLAQRSVECSTPWSWTVLMMCGRCLCDLEGLMMEGLIRHGIPDKSGTTNYILNYELYPGTSPVSQTLSTCRRILVDCWDRARQSTPHEIRNV